MSWTRRQIFTSLVRPRATTDKHQSNVCIQTDSMSDETWDALLHSAMSRYARNKEELLIRHFFRDRPGGAFIDAGCFQPEKNSATCYLERHLGWSGLGIDAQDLSETWQSFRPKSRFVQALLSERANVPETLYLADGSSTLISERLDEEPFPWEKRPQPMVSSTLDRVLERAGVASFDFLAISVNGADLRALAGLDLDRYRPRLIKILCVTGQRLPTIDYLRAAGYRLIKGYRPFDPLNRYFTPEPSNP